MKSLKWVAPVLLAVMTFAVTAEAVEGARVWQVQNRLRFEYDDNIYQSSDNEESSGKVIEEAEFHLNFNLSSTFVALRYRPTFVYWEDRDEDDTDFHHDAEFVINHRASPRLSYGLKNTFRLQEQPELIEQGTLVDQENDYIFNDLNAFTDIELAPQTRLDLGGRYVILQYDESDVAEREDFDMYVLGGTVNVALNPETTARFEIRYEDVAYDSDVNRDSTSYFAGIGSEKIFSPNFIGDVRLGWEHKELDSADHDRLDDPYADVSVTLIPSPDTRISAGAGYSQFEPNVYPFANQERLRFFGSLAHDFTAKIALFFTTTFTQGSYESDEVDESITVDGGDEDIIILGTRVTYQLNRTNWLELGYRLTDLSSDLRQEFDRNRVHVGWKTQL